MIDHVPAHADRPNVLIVLTDQQRYDAVGFTNPLIKTPHLDRLAATGTVCDHAYVQSPQCQPSRTSIMTGRYPTAHRVWWNETPVPLQERTLGNYLSDAGYSTGYFGKLHFDGHGNYHDVANHFGFKNVFLTEDWQDLISSRHLGQKGHTQIETEFYGPMSLPHWTGRLTHKELHHEEIITWHATRFLRTSRRPYFVVVGFHGPHPPYAAPDEFSSVYKLEDMLVPSVPVKNYQGTVISDQQWRELKVQYYGAISWIDDCVGRLLAVVDNNNTIVVYTSDHGDILGDHGLFSKGLFAYDGNVRVPLVLRGPGLPVGHHPHLVQAIDLVPTLLALAGVVPPPAVQGRDLSRCLRDGVPGNEWVLSMIGHKPRLRMLRTNNLKYWICDDQEVLFELQRDPMETTNFQDNQLLCLARGLLLKALICAEDPLPVPLRRRP